MSLQEPASAWDEPAGPTSTYRYRGFWIRVAATLIDVVVFAIPLNIVMYVIGLYGTGFGTLLQTVIGALYPILLWVRWGATIGGRVTGLRLVKVDGTPVDYGTAVVRYLMLLVSAVALGVGLIWVAFHPKKQGWMDLVAGTYVVDASSVH